MSRSDGGDLGPQSLDPAEADAIAARAMLARDAFDDAFARGDMDAADRALADIPSADHDAGPWVTIDVGYVHSLTEDGACRDDCPHPDHRVIPPRRGAVVNLGDHRAMAVALLGERSPAVAFLDDKIDESPHGADEEVIAPEEQMVYLLLTIHRDGYVRGEQ